MQLDAFLKLMDFNDQLGKTPGKILRRLPETSPLRPTPLAAHGVQHWRIVPEDGLAWQCAPCSQQRIDYVRHSREYAGTRDGGVSNLPLTTMPKVNLDDGFNTRCAASSCPRASNSSI